MKVTHQNNNTIVTSTQNVIISLNEITNYNIYVERGYVSIISNDEEKGHICMVIVLNNKDNIKQKMENITKKYGTKLTVLDYINNDVIYYKPMVYV